MESPCSSCGNPISYTVKLAGKAVKCPHCGEVTQLPSEPKAPVDWKRRLKIIRWILLPLLFALLVFLLLKYLPQIANNLEIVQAIPAIVLIILTVLFAVLVLAWLLFPILVWVKCNEMIDEQRRTNLLLRR